MSDEEEKQSNAEITFGQANKKPELLDKAEPQPKQKKGQISNDKNSDADDKNYTPGVDHNESILFNAALMTRDDDEEFR
jgi:hypothetical protein